jgi:GNAT superfamily N-acetyltransferase
MNEPSMECALSLRSATAGDAEGIAQLAAQLGYPSDARAIRERLELILPASDHLLIVAESSSGIAGWLHAFVIDSVESPRRVQIDGLVIDEAFRRQKVGRRLVEYAEAWALSLSIPIVGVNSNVLRTESHPFYRGLGFTVAKTQIAYRKPL